MILILSHARDEHARMVQRELDALGAPWHQFDLARFPAEYAMAFSCDAGGAGACLSAPGGTEIDLAACRAIWWRRPLPFEIAPEVSDPDDRQFAYSECHEALTGLWQVLDALWINDPVRDEQAARKLYQLHLARRLGLHVPETCITNDPDTARRFIDAHQRVIYKTFSATERAWRETRLLRPEERALLDQVRHAPVIFQRCIDAVADLRITVVGQRIYAAAIDTRDTEYQVDFRMVMHQARIEPYALPEAVASDIRRLMDALGLVYGAIDMRLTPDGRHVFLEINPAGQWLFVEDATGLPITRAMAELMAGIGEEASETESRSAPRAAVV